MLWHELLHIVRRGAHDTMAVEAYHVGTPLGIVLVDEDGGVGVQRNDVGVVLHTHHVDSLAQGGIHITEIAEAAGDGILADIDAGPLTVVAVVLVESLREPGRIAVVVLVEQVDGQLRVPLGVIIAPGHDITDEVHLGILRQDGPAELVIALVVVVALILGIGLVVLVAYLQILNVERCGVAVLGTQGTVLGGDVAVGILQGGQTLVNPRLDVGIRRHTTVPQTDVDHIERLGSEVFGHLQILVETDAVGGAVAPVDVPVAGTLLDGADGTFPAEGIVGRYLSLDEAAAGEAHELRMHLVEHLCQVGAQTVLAILEGRREERHDIEVEGTLAIEDKGKLSLRVAGRGGQRSSVLAPLLGADVGGQTTDHCLGIDGGAVLATESGLERALVGALSPEAQTVGAPLNGIDAPETFVDEADRSLRRGSNGQLQGVALGCVQQLDLLARLNETHSERSAW